MKAVTGIQEENSYCGAMENSNGAMERPIAVRNVKN
jgi:hypothetical protein